MKPKNEIGIGILGLGVVGSGVAKFVFENASKLMKQTGYSIALERILVRNLAGPRAYKAPSKLLTTDVDSILNNPKVNIIVEVMGGQNPALDYIIKAISLGKHVITANKEVMANHGPDLLTLAREKNVHLLFEASVAAGTPVIAPILRDLVANDILTIHGIINGTTNYILTKMSKEGVDFDDALKEAQELGYAEADPANDIEGTDTVYKLAILATLAFHTRVKSTDIYREGISRLRARDFIYAADLGYTIKLMAMADKTSGQLQIRVHPVFVPADAPIANVDGVLNAVEIQTDLAGPILFHGRGAGSMSTTSAVVADVISVVRNIGGNLSLPSELVRLDSQVILRPMEELETKYYLRMNVLDKPGVLAQITKVLGGQKISIASIIQKESDNVAQRAELVLMTHRAREAAIQEATKRLKMLNVVQEIGNLVRVEELTVSK